MTTGRAVGEFPDSRDTRAAARVFAGETCVPAPPPAPGLLGSERDVVRCLVTYTDWWQLVSASVLQLGGRGRRHAADGLRPGLVETIEERTELCRRMALITPRERHVLFLWYVGQLAAGEVAGAVGISRRQCFRVRARALRRLVELGRPERAA
jgi:DNA-directed RNA polymerase specialized sigma24 family protein